MNSTSDDIVSRWSTAEGQQKTEAVVWCLESSDLSRLEGIVGRYQDRIDLRGFPFPRPIRSGRPLHVGGYEITVKDSLSSFSDLTLKGVDLSESEMSSTLWSRCSLVDCLFRDSNLRDALFRGARVEDCLFQKCDLSGSLLGGNEGSHTGSIARTRFDRVKFDNVVFAAPRIEGCVFNCSIADVDFEGSQIVACKFAGKLDRVIFRRRFRISSQDNPRYFSGVPDNEMIDVDFRDAVFEDVDFCGGVSLQRCVLPRKGGVFLVAHGDKIFPRVRDVIEREWGKAERARQIAGFVEKYYLNRISGGQTDFVVESDAEIEAWGSHWGGLFVNLIRSEMASTPAPQ